MRQRTSIFDAPGINARPRVIAPRSLAVFTVVVAAVFVLMVPNPTLERRAIESRRGDLLTVSYLANLLRTDPDDPELRFALASMSDAETLLHASSLDPPQSTQETGEPAEGVNAPT